MESVRLTIPLAALLVITAAPLLPAQAPRTGDARRASRSVCGSDPNPAFIAFDPDSAAKHAGAARALRELQLELARQAAAGRATPASRQVFLEARWLVYYSASWDRI